MEVTLAEIRNRRRKGLFTWRLDESLQLESGTDQHSELRLAEDAELMLSLAARDGESLDFLLRLYLGNVLVASSLDDDHVSDFHVPDTDSGVEQLVCRGKFLEDWIGHSILRLEATTSAADQWRMVLECPLIIEASKIEHLEFEALIDDLAHYSRSILYDVYGKAFLGVRPRQASWDRTPVVATAKLRNIVGKMGACLRRIRKNPALAMKTKFSRVAALPTDSITAETTHAACLDTSFIARSQGAVCFRERLQEICSYDTKRYENAMIARFLTSLSRHARDLIRRTDVEVRCRQEMRSYRHRPAEHGGRSWWEKEDEPRIVALKLIREELVELRRKLEAMKLLEFLPQVGSGMVNLPRPTSLIRFRPEYREAYLVMADYFTDHSLMFDDSNLLTRAKSIPVLYEWWCALQVLVTLQKFLKVESGSTEHTNLFFRKLIDENERFVIEFADDQSMAFVDGRGRLIRFRYHPAYKTRTAAHLESYGLLFGGSVKTPDMSIEVFSEPDDGDNSIPELIIVLDAKYTSRPSRWVVDELRTKYSGIGHFASGRLLSRQVWGLAPQRSTASAAFISECSVDSDLFLADNFDMNTPVVGVVQVKPGQDVAEPPLERLLVQIFKKCSVLPLGEAQGR